MRYDFPKRGDMPPVRMTWYEGGKHPSPEQVDGRTFSSGFNGSLFKGSKGSLLMEHGQEPKLLPEKDFAGFVAPTPYLPRPESHYKQWLDACKSGGMTGSNFDYAAPMTEAIL